MNGAHRKKRVLIVEDEASLRGLFAEALHDSGWSVETAANGLEAMNVLHRWVSDAIVLDLMMPRLDGEGFTNLMRLNPRFADIPVVLVTAAYKAVEAGARVGAHAVLRKPFELEQLVETLSQVCRPSPSPPPVQLRATRGRHSAKPSPPPASQ